MSARRAKGYGPIGPARLERVRRTDEAFDKGAMDLAQQWLNRLSVNGERIDAVGALVACEILRATLRGQIDRAFMHAPDSEKELFEAQLAKELGRLVPNPEGLS